MTAQATRLKKFFEMTGLSMNEFARQCNIPSVRTISKIITDGDAPTTKTLEKIISRFPQLNHDWVVLGYGEMIVKGLQTQETSAESLKMSNDSVYNQIQAALRDHDYALNELSVKVEKAIAKIDENTNLQNVKIDYAAEKQQLEFKNFEQLIRNAAISTIQTANDMSTNFFKLYEENIKRVDNLINKRQERLIQRQEQQEQENRDFINRLDQERKERNDKHATDLKKEIKSLFEKNIQAQKNRMDVDLKHHEQDFQKLLDKLNDKIEKAITKITNKSDLNTKKALDFVEGLGKLTKHSSPTPSK